MGTKKSLQFRPRLLATIGYCSVSRWRRRQELEELRGKYEFWRLLLGFKQAPRFFRCSVQNTLSSVSSSSSEATPPPTWKPSLWMSESLTVVGQGRNINREESCSPPARNFLPPLGPERSPPSFSHAHT